MMENLGEKLGVARPEYVIVFLLIAILALINYFGAGQRFFLNFYFLPVVVAGYMLGVRGGVMASVASISVVVLYYLVFNTEPVPTVDSLRREFWADMTLWGCFLVLSGGAVGKLQQKSAEALADLTQAYSGVLEILVKFIDTADRYTEAHSVRVSILSTEIARELSLCRRRH